MFFPLSKVVGFFLLPSNLMITLALFGAGLMLTRFHHAGRRITAISILALAVAGWSPLGNLLMAPLEDRFPPWDTARGAPDGIVVLGGAISPELSAARGEAGLNESAERMTAVADLARRYPAARILFTGGSGNLIVRGASEAEFAIALFETFGIPRERILLEPRARNTAENARFSKELAQPKPGERWLLVTSAHHMPRSVGAFRQEGFPVEAYPVDWRTRGKDEWAASFSSLAAGLARTDAAAHEWAGLLAYRLTGKTTALFPAP